MTDLYNCDGSLICIQKCTQNVCRIWSTYCVTTAKLKRRHEETPGYNPGTLEKFCAWICQSDTLYKSIVLYERQGGSQEWPSLADRSLDARFCAAQKRCHPVRSLSCSNLYGRYTLVTLPRNVTPYRDSVDGNCNHVTYKKLVTRLRLGLFGVLSVFGRRVKGMVRLWPEQVWTGNVTRHHRPLLP